MYRVYNLELSLATQVQGVFRLEHSLATHVQVSHLEHRLLRYRVSPLEHRLATQVPSVED